MPKHPGDNRKEGAGMSKQKTYCGQGARTWRR